VVDSVSKEVKGIDVPGDENVDEDGEAKWMEIPDKEN
jgi:hypothetical protein